MKNKLKMITRINKNLKSQLLDKFFKTDRQSKLSIAQLIILIHKKMENRQMICSKKKKAKFNSGKKSNLKYFLKIR